MSPSEATLPFSDFLNPTALPVLLAQTLRLWAAPFIILAIAVVAPWRIGLRDDQHRGSGPRRPGSAVAATRT